MAANAPETLATERRGPAPWGRRLAERPRRPAKGGAAGRCGECGEPSTGDRCLECRRLACLFCNDHYVFGAARPGTSSGPAVSGYCSPECVDARLERSQRRNADRRDG